MRIIAGKHKGRRIELAGRDTGAIRPTSDFARQAIFNILTHGYSDSFMDSPVLDLFCGTGAFGLEALSRGASQVTFIDQSREAIASARHNAERLGETASAEFVQADATRLPRAKRAHALAFLDPPYFGGLIPPALASLKAGGWVGVHSLIVAEHDVKETIALPEGFRLLDERRYGRAVVKLINLAEA